jgi:hypothetical protein
LEIAMSQIIHAHSEDCATRRFRYEAARDRGASNLRFLRALWMAACQSCPVTAARAKHAA